MPMPRRRPTWTDGMHYGQTPDSIYTSQELYHVAFFSSMSVRTIGWPFLSMTLPRLVLLMLLICATASRGEQSLPVAPVDSDFHYGGEVDADLFKLGQKLFFDKVISGNRNIACSGCHHPALGTGDGLALSIGEGGNGIGQDRDTGSFPNEVTHRVGRNAQPLFNLGAREFRRMFHDGRLEVGASGEYEFLSPAGVELPDGLDNVLAAQAMFPVVSPDEMAGQDGENPVATAVADGDRTRAWALLVVRLTAIPEYVDDFLNAFDEIESRQQISFVHAANAMAAFQAVAWRATDSPFDRYLGGDASALSDSEQRGLDLFYGRAGCARCHSGPFQTDHEFHSVGVPQIGPGKGNGFDGHEDFGREVITGEPSDRYRFRTAPLRNVELTGPWGHSGAYDSLREMLQHHLNPTAGFAVSRPLQPHRPDLSALDFLVVDDPVRSVRISSRSEIESPRLGDEEINDLLSFLGALTDPSSRRSDNTIPASVPSGLLVDRVTDRMASRSNGSD